MELFQFIPPFLIELFTDNIPARRLAALQKVTNVANAVAKDLVSTKSYELLEGKGKRDIMSLLGMKIVLFRPYSYIGAFSESQCWREPKGPAH